MSHSSFCIYGGFMLVYLKEPMGAAVIGGKRIMGKYYARGTFGPTNISRAVYFANKTVLEEFEYSSEWLERKFGLKFPQMRFTPSTFYLIDFNTVVELARLVGIDYKSKGNKEYTDIEKRALRRSILGKLDE